MLQTVSRIEVHYAETDRMGIIHHSVYPIYFEVGRTDWFVTHFRHYDELEQEGLLAPVLGYHVELQNPATYGDVLLLETRPSWLAVMILPSAATGEA